MHNIDLRKDVNSALIDGIEYAQQKLPSWIWNSFVITTAPIKIVEYYTM